MNKYYLGIDIGGTKCAAILGYEENGSAVVQDKEVIPTETKKGLQNTLDRLYAAIDTVLERNQMEPSALTAIGISCGGPLNSKTGYILSPPNLYGWDNVPITEMMETRYGVKTFLENDANACTLAEWKFGAGKGYENVIFLTFGTGMGAGLILDGRLYSGTTGMAGEIGHVRLTDHGPVGYGKEGSFEGYCSGGGIAQVARTKALEQLQRGKTCAYCAQFTDLENITAKDVAMAAKAGDETAIAAYNETAYYLGRGLSILIDVLNPEIIVLGSIYERSGDLLRDKTMEVIGCEALAASAKDCVIAPAKLGDQIGDIAALSVAINGIQ